MNDKARLERRLADLKAELGKVEGRPTEVYSRIVGYYRSVRNWNAGKREEYGHRLTYRMPSATALPVAGAPRGKIGGAAPLPRSEAVRGKTTPKAEGDLLVFTRASCPNCPPVKEYVKRSGLPAVFVDVDAEEGLALARRHQVLSTPTVLGLDAEGREAFRARDLRELKGRVENLPRPVLA